MGRLVREYEAHGGRVTDVGAAAAPTKKRAPRRPAQDSVREGDVNSAPPQSANFAGVAAVDDVQTLIALFDLLRANGVTPYPSDPKLTDESAAAMLLEAGLPEAPAENSALAFDERHPVLEWGTATDVAPSPPEQCPIFGVAEAFCPTLRSADDGSAGHFGRFPNVLRDIADMGAGCIRRVKKCDIYWGSLFPLDRTDADSFQDGEEIPKPADMLANIRMEGYAALADATSFLIGCKLAGIKVALTPFNACGGATLTYSDSDAAGPLVMIDGTSVPLSSLVSGRPDHMAQLVTVVSSLGWHEWYVQDHDSGSATGDAYTYQKYALYVSPTMGWPASAPPSLEGYHQECARRKGLGIAAFATGIGEWLAKVDVALRAWDVSLGNPTAGVLSVVDYIELGNEIDAGHWHGGRESTLGQEARSWNAGGRYMALLAAPLHAAVPGLRFRASELLSPKPETQPAFNDCTPLGGLPYTSSDCCPGDTFESQLLWLIGAIRTGMPNTLTEWGGIQLSEHTYRTSHVTVSDDDLAYVQTCKDAGFWWPPLVADFRAIRGWSESDLRHQVGFHWYRNIDRSGGTENVALYRDEVKLAHYIARFQAAFGGMGLTTSIGEVAVASMSPSPLKSEDTGSYLFGANAQVQASKLVRILLTAAAAGVERVSWFCHILAVIRAASPTRPANDWSENLATTGLHNDVFIGNEAGWLATRPVWAAEWAWRKEIWYSFQRLAWLMSRARSSDVRLVASENGATLIRIRLHPTPIGGDGSVDGVYNMGDDVYKYAWIMWLDEYSGSRCQYGDPPGGGVSVTVELSSSSRASNPEGTVVSLVPMVAGTGGPGAVDSAGFRAADSVDWEWIGWHDALYQWRQSSAPNPTVADLVLRKSTFQTHSPPICMFNNLDSGRLLW